MVPNEPRGLGIGDLFVSGVRIEAWEQGVRLGESNRCAESHRVGEALHT